MGKKEGLIEEIGIPDGVEARIENKDIVIKGPNGEVKKTLVRPTVHIEIKDKKIIIKSSNMTKRGKKLMGTFRSLINNIIKGTIEKHNYLVKICSGHFPMNVVVEKGHLIIKNFFGEKYPRKLKLKDGADVRVNGDLITIEGPSKELCGQIATDIEQLTRRTRYDRRIFQDGCYIVSKDNKKIK